MPPRRKKRRAYTPSTEELMRRELKRANTCIQKALAMQMVNGGHSENNERFAALLADLQQGLTELHGGSTHGASDVQTSTTHASELVDIEPSGEATECPARLEVEATETIDGGVLEKSSTRIESTTYGDSDTETDDFDSFDDLVESADDLAERAAIQDEANGLPLTTPEISLSATTAAAVPPQPTTSTITIASTPPLEDVNAAYKRYNKLIDDCAAELALNGGVTDIEAQRQAWSEVGEWSDWSKRNCAPMTATPQSHVGST